MLYSYMSLAGGSPFSFTLPASQWKTHGLQIPRMNSTDEGFKVHTALLRGVLIPRCCMHASLFTSVRNSCDCTNLFKALQDQSLFVSQ